MVLQLRLYSQPAPLVGKIVEDNIHLQLTIRRTVSSLLAKLGLLGRPPEVCDFSALLSACLVWTDICYKLKN